MFTKNNKSIILLLLCLATNTLCDFYLPGFRYYNSSKCYDASTLNNFANDMNPNKNHDKFIKMKGKLTATNSNVTMGAYFSSSKKSELIDSHNFFENLSKFDEKEKSYFPSHIYCYKNVNFLFNIFGAFDSYGLIYYLNPSINEYTKKSVIGSSPYTLLDIFELFLDYSRGLKLVFAQNYYISDLNDEDLGVYLKREENDGVKVQGRLRLLHKMRKGIRGQVCRYAEMSNHSTEIYKFKKNSGKKNFYDMDVEACQNLNIAALFSVFEKFAKEIIARDFEGQIIEFPDCFSGNKVNKELCPSPFKAITDSTEFSGLYSSIKDKILNYTTKSVIEKTIQIFERLRDAEIQRLIEIERKNLAKLNIEKMLKAVAKKRLKEKAVNVFKNALKKSNADLLESSNGQVSINDEQSDIREGRISFLNPNIDVHSHSIKTENPSNANIHFKKLEIDNINNPDFKSDNILLDKNNKSLNNFSPHSFSENNQMITDVEIKPNSHQIDKDSEASSTSTEIKNQEKIINQNNEIKNKIMANLVNSIKEKINKDKDEDIQTEQNKPKTPKVSEVPILESEERVLSQEFKKEQILKNFQENLIKRVKIIEDENERQMEIEKIDDIKEIMDLKLKIDEIKNDENPKNDDTELDNKIADITSKIDLAIKKYGSSTEVVDSNQVKITLNTLKRELDPYYLKKEFKNEGLKAKVENDNFAFL